ncbi:MAG: carboxylesterase family protein [Terracidiphilus sp.]|nr:carboxylesterase family protein [Terracidiphilus sp.]MDR3776209.1 carboxylesterase family protein [Terracidiphilus sp.]
MSGRGGFLRNGGLTTPVYVCTLLAAFFLHCGFAALAQDAPGPVVSVTGGKVQGRLLPAAGGVAFKGIPFAQPPVNELRWRESPPVKPWTTVLQADHYGAPCAQRDTGWNKATAQKSSEDCLYLNVWAPEWPPKTKKAVMVWLHGGGNEGGSSMGGNGIEPSFDGASLASHGVILVSINYRLGLFGFMGHPELTAESSHHASGGYGLLDQIAALQWVHDNIARFGGDPGNVTVFGQSAGAHDTSILVTSPLAKGLIHKAIDESGSATLGEKRVETPADRENMGLILAEILKAPSTSAIHYLRGLPASPEFHKVLNDKHLALDVGTDGYAEPQFSGEVYRTSKEPPLPMIFGNNGQDNPGQRFGGPNSSPEEIRAAMKKRIETYYARYPELVERALNLYGFKGSGSEEVIYPPYGSAAIQLGADLAQRCSTVTVAGWHSTIAPTYEYEFTAGTASHRPEHSAELAFVFGHLGDQESDAALRKLSDQMEQYWTNFAKTGDPNGPGLPKWPKHDLKNRQYVELSNEGVLAKAALRQATCAVYTEELTRDFDARLKR